MLYYEIRKKKLGELIAKTSLSAFAEKTGRSKSLYIPEGEEALLTDMCDVNENAYALTITDDSMVPVFSRGDKIIVDPDVRPVPGDYVVASTPSGFVFRKYRLLEEGFSLRPLNEDYPPIAGDKARVVAVMLEHRVYRKVAT